MQTCEEWFTSLYCDSLKLKEWYQIHMHQIVQRTSGNESVECHDHKEDKKQVVPSASMLFTQDVPSPLINPVPPPLIIPPPPIDQPKMYSLHTTTKRKRERLASVPEEEELSKENVPMRINNIYTQDAMWWFGSMHHTHLISCQKNELALHNNVLKNKRAMFNKRTVRGFRNFFYLE